MSYPSTAISEVASFVNGFAFKPEDWGTTGLPIIRIQNLTDVEKPYNLTDREVPEKYRVINGDILVSWSATIDVFEWDKGDALLNQHIFKVDFDHKRIDKQYFKEALRKTIFDLSRYAHGATMKHVVKKDFENHQIPLPPLDDQKRIAHLLGKVEGLIKQRKQHLQQLDDLLKSVFLEMFGDPVRNEKEWEKKPCSEIADLISGYPFKSDFYTDDNTQIQLCGGLIIYPGQIDWEKCNFWPKKLADGLDRYYLRAGDIVLAMDRPWISSGLKISIVDEYGNGSLLVQRTACIREKSIDQLFLYQHLRDRSFTIHCKPTETTVPHISIKDLQTFEVICPPPELQNKFAAIFKKIEGIKSRYQQSLTDLESIYGALSQKAFKGELDLSRIRLAGDK